MAKYIIIHNNWIRYTVDSVIYHVYRSLNLFDAKWFVAQDLCSNFPNIGCRNNTDFAMLPHCCVCNTYIFKIGTAATKWWNVYVFSPRAANSHAFRVWHTQISMFTCLHAFIFFHMLWGFTHGIKPYHQQLWNRFMSHLRRPTTLRLFSQPAGQCIFCQWSLTNEGLIIHRCQQHVWHWFACSQSPT